VYLDFSDPVKHFVHFVPYPVLLRRVLDLPLEYLDVVLHLLDLCLDFIDYRHLSIQPQVRFDLIEQVLYLIAVLLLDLDKLFHRINVLGNYIH
jgi:hypothetical protein